MRAAAQTVDFRIFGTLTYATEFLPADSKHVRTFFNRIKSYDRKYNKKEVKLEYVWREDFGKKKGRPHYHFLANRRIDYNRAVSWWAKGFIYLSDVWSNYQVNEYVSKYMAKSEHTRDPEIALKRRRFGFSKGIPKTPMIVTGKHLRF